jgi:hypothetical protein
MGGMTSQCLAISRHCTSSDAWRDVFLFLDLCGRIFRARCVTRFHIVSNNKKVNASE